MGAAQSLTEEQISQLKSETSFDEEALERLYKSFRAIDSDKNGQLSVDEIKKIPSLKNNPLVERVIDIFDIDKSGEVDFVEFVKWLNHFTIDSVNREARRRFVFQIYDLNNDGYISNGDLFKVLRIMVGNNLDDTQLQQLVDRTILQGDKDCDGRLTYEEFAALTEEVDVMDRLTIEF